ncbi:MAG: site-specific integrase [Planctomycetes bacterium]|nr:site-specific integrase [Planctomycetota bacterium]
MATTKVSCRKDPRKKHPWVVRWFGEYDPATDKQRRYSKSFRLKRDAERLQAEKQAEFDKGAQRDQPARITVQTFVGKYLARRKHEWSEKTRRLIADVGIRLIEHFGEDTLLRSITPDRASAFWSQAKLKGNKSTGQQPSRSTMNGLLRDSKTMFKYAVEWGYIAANPFGGIRRLRIGKRSQTWHYITPHDYRALLKAAPDLRWKVLYALAYTSAARFGELFHLTVDNIDFGRGRLLIKSREGTDKLPPFQAKDHEDRKIPLPRHTLRLLSGWLRVRPKGSPFILLTPERYERVLERWRNHRASGKPWVNDYMVNNTLTRLNVHAKHAGLELDGALTMHGFRKSCGQNWADNLPMNVVKELMGHANIATTAEYYSTVTDDHEVHAQWVTEAITFGTKDRQSDARMTPEPKISPIRSVG